MYSHGHYCIILLEHIYDEIKFTNYEYQREKLRLLKRIGEGNFGCVYKAEAENIKGSHGKSTVAVKVLKGKIVPFFVPKSSLR